MTKFESAFNINDEILFTPFLTMGNADPTHSGRVVGVLFTESKVYYDIFDYHEVRLYNKVDSANVNPTS